MSKPVSLKTLIIATFLLSYGFWLSILIANHFSHWQYGTPIFMLFFILGGLSPTIVAYILLRQNHTFTGFLPFLKKIFNPQASLKHYFLVLFFLALNLLIPFLFNAVAPGLPWPMIFWQLPMMIVGGGLEEVAWRYLLQPSLEKRFPFFLSTCLTAFIWTIWHLPLFFIAGTIQSNLNFGLFLLLLIGLSFALATIYYLSKSVWLCILFHALANSLATVFIVQQNLFVSTITTISLAAFALILVYNHIAFKQDLSKI